MIKPISYEEIIKVLRNAIIENSDLPAERVLNALSVRGTDLSEILNHTQVYSYSLKDVFILFELLKDQNGDNFVTPKNDEYMLTVSSYQFHLIIYGNASDDCSQKIRSIFHQGSVVSDLRENGIHITTVTSGETINEFLNNTLWLRNDLIINFQTTFESKNVKKEEYFDGNYTIKDIDLYVKEMKNI